ncbi:MAG: hypothetical protein QOD07_2964 [Frankiaceae bacterium]|jgi:hypothetical protein|nr:hypothetical protein [Frankiaceae bacterium]
MTPVEQEVLSLLTEDYYGPWEIAVQVPVERGRIISAIENLLNGGLVEWFGRPDDSAAAVRLRQVGGIAPDLSDDAAWTAPSPNSPQLLLGITDEGKRAYFDAGS